MKKTFYSRHVFTLLTFSISTMFLFQKRWKMAYTYYKQPYGYSIRLIKGMG